MIRDDNFQYLCKDQFMKQFPKDIFTAHFYNVFKIRDVQPPQSVTEPVYTVSFSCLEPSIVGPYVDVTQTRAAYGASAIPKLLKEMFSANKILSYQAMNTLLDLLHNPTKAREAINHNIIGRLLKLIGQEDDLNSQVGLACLRVLASQPGAKQAILSNKCVLYFLKFLVQDREQDVRYQAVLTLHSLAQNWFAVHELVKKGFIEIIIEILLKLDNSPVIVKHLLEILEFMVEIGDESRIRAIASDILLLAPLLDHEKNMIRSAAASVIGQIFRCKIGRMAAAYHDLIRQVTVLLDNKDIKVVTKAAMALSFATIEAYNRKKAVNLKVICNLMETLAHANKISPSLELSSVKVLTNIAELEKTNSELYRFLNVFQALPTHNSKLLQEHIGILIDTIVHTRSLTK